MAKLSDDKILGLFNIIDQKFSNQVEKLDAIHAQTTLTNGRVTRIEKILLVVGVAGAVLAVVYFPQILTVIKLFV